MIIIPSVGLATPLASLITCLAKCSLLCHCLYNVYKGVPSTHWINPDCSLNGITAYFLAFKLRNEVYMNKERGWGWKRMKEEDWWWMESLYLFILNQDMIHYPQKLHYSFVQMLSFIEQKRIGLEVYLNKYVEPIVYIPDLRFLSINMYNSFHQIPLMPTFSVSFSWAISI